MRLGFAISRAGSIEPTWTTAHIACKALERGHSVRFIEPWDFEVDPLGRLVARSHALDPTDGPLGTPALCDLLQRRQARRRFVELARLDALLLRCNPVDLAVLSFAQAAQQAGVVVLNDPGTLLRTSHKAFLAQLHGIPRPRTLITRSRATALSFAAEEDRVVLKPARASGGRGIALVPGRAGAALDEAFEAARAIGDGYVVVQEYLPEAERGEKRLVWLDGQILGSYVRQRAAGEFRHNLKRGGVPEPGHPTPEDLKLLDALTPQLREHGIWFAGIDVIGGRVVEINTLNPGGLHLSQEFAERDLAEPIITSLQARVEEARS
jgi:glutathione synthase